MVSCVASHPRDAQRVCEALTSKIVQKNLEFIQASAKGTVDVLTQGIESTRLQLNDQGSKLAVNEERSHHESAAAKLTFRQWK
jgi:hypothetical protein